MLSPHVLPDRPPAPRPALLPIESLALTMAKAQLALGENPPINTTTMLVVALDRIVNGVDWANEIPA